MFFLAEGIATTCRTTRTIHIIYTECPTGYLQLYF